MLLRLLVQIQLKGFKTDFFFSPMEIDAQETELRDISDHFGNPTFVSTELKKQAVAEFNFHSIFTFAGVCTKSAIVFLFIN
jgi:hypothetical protein